MSINDTAQLWIARKGAITQKLGDSRAPFQRDLGIILHSDAFRRLQGKTQVFPPEAGDFHRTRLTHSLEVAQIGRGIIWQLNNTEDPSLQPLLASSELIETICLAHDLGHPPFGHGGEIGLNQCMHAHGGFEANAQTLRILTQLGHHDIGYGLNLTRRALLGVIKYPVFYQDCRSVVYEQTHPDYWPAKCLYDENKAIFDYIMAPFSSHDVNKLQQLALPPSAEGHGRSQYKSLDTSIMELADDIAYATHDLEDAIKLQMIDYASLHRSLAKINYPAVVTEDMACLQQSILNRNYHQLKTAVSGLIHGFITHITLKENTDFAHPLLRYNAVLPSAFQQMLASLKKIVLDKVISSSQAIETVKLRQQIIVDLFNVLIQQPETFLSADEQQQAIQTEGIHRVVADYLSGMTDGYAIKMHAKLY